MKKNTQDVSKRFGEREKGRVGINGQDGSGENGVSQIEQAHGFQAKQMKTTLSSTQGR